MPVKRRIGPVAVQLQQVGDAVELALAILRFVDGVGDGVEVPLRRGAGNRESINEVVASGIGDSADDGGCGVGGEIRGRSGEAEISPGASVANAGGADGIGGAGSLRAGDERHFLIPSEQRGAGDGEAGDAEVCRHCGGVGDGFIERDDEAVQCRRADDASDHRAGGVAAYRQHIDVEDALDVPRRAVGALGVILLGCVRIVADAHGENVRGVGGGAPVVQSEERLRCAVVVDLHRAVCTGGAARVAEVEVCRARAGDARAICLRVVRGPKLDIARGDTRAVHDARDV